MSLNRTTVLALGVGILSLLSAARASAEELPPPALVGEVAVEVWVPQAGDRLVVDTAVNQGFLVRADGSFTRMPVATGQRRWVRYIGLTYYAATPERRWVARTSEVKGDRTTYGEDGVFLRLFYRGERTNYGIHAYREDRLHQDEDRYRSMGCIVPRRADLALIVRTFDLNAQELVVVTSRNVPDPVGLAFSE